MGLSRRQEERVKQELTDALINLCRTSFTFRAQLCIEGLLGITVDSTDVVLVKVDETIVAETRRKERKLNTQNSQSESNGKKGKPKKGRTRGRGRPAASRKRAHSPEEKTLEDNDENVIVGQVALHSDDDDNCAAISDGETNRQDIKEEPEDSLDANSDSEETLDSETNKNLSCFLHNLISAHGSENVDETESATTKVTSNQKAHPKVTTAHKPGWTPPVKVPKSMRLPREITGPIKRKLYPESAIKEAIRLVKEEKYSMRAASLATGCPPSTLHRRFFQEELKTSGKKPLLTPHGEETLCSYIQMRMSSGQKVTSSWAMGLAAILARNDGIEFNTQHGGPSFGWWMRFKTRHPELGLLNSPGKELSQPLATATPQSGLVQSPASESVPSTSTGEKDILHIAAADAIGHLDQESEKKTVQTENDVQSNVIKETEEQISIDRQSVETQANTEGQPNVTYMGGQMYY